MPDEQEFKGRLKEALGIGEYEFYEGTVETVNDDDTADILIDEEVTIPGVKLRAASDGTKTGIILVPEKDSYVVFAKVRGEADYVLIKTTGIDKVIFDVTTSMEGKCPKVILTLDQVELKAKEVKIDSGTIAFNGGGNKGLAKVLSIAERLNLIEQDLTIAKAAVSSWAVTPLDGGAALKTALMPWYGATLVLTQAAMLENNEITH